MSLEDIPADFATYLGITEATAQVILSMVIILTFLLPVAYVTKGDRMMMLVTLFLSSCICVGITWLPFWVLIIIICIVVAGFSQVVSRGTVGD